MFTRCHHVARTPPAFFSLELRRPLRSISTAGVLRERSARPIATELPTTPAPMTITSNRSDANTQPFYQNSVVELGLCGRLWGCQILLDVHVGDLFSGYPRLSGCDCG